MEPKCDCQNYWGFVNTTPKSLKSRFWFQNKILLNSLDSFGIYYKIWLPAIWQSKLVFCQLQELLNCCKNKYCKSTIWNKTSFLNHLTWRFQNKRRCQCIKFFYTKRRKMSLYKESVKMAVRSNFWNSMDLDPDITYSFECLAYKNLCRAKWIW